MPYRYSCYCLTIEVPFRCRWLAPATGEPDVVVEEGVVPYHLEAPIVSGEGFAASPGRFLWRGGLRAGRFLVEDGNRVTLDRGPDAEDELTAAHLLSQVLPAVLRHRGLLVLHADAVATTSNPGMTQPGSTGPAVAIAGPSGAGKTTTTMALLGRGCSHVADDGVVLRRTGDGNDVVVLPGPARLHLFDETADRLGVDSQGLSRYPLRPAKAVVVPEATVSRPIKLASLFILQTHSGSDVRMERLFGADAFAALQDCVLGPLLPSEHPAVFPILAATASSVAVYRTERPAGRWSATEVADVILASVA